MIPAPVPPCDEHDDPLDLLIDLSRMPVAGDERHATHLETRVYAEQTAAADAKDMVAFQRAQTRSIAAAHYRMLICAALEQAA